MSAEVYYFSGTGNSLIVARDIAAKIGGDLIPIASVIDRDVIQPSGEVIGIVFPVYYGGLPPVVKQFAAKLADIGNRYIFAICTYGGGTGDSLKTLGRIIRSRGGKLAAQYGVHMPQNAFRKPWENRPRIFEKWQQKREKIDSRLARRKEGMFFSDRLARILLTPVYLAVKPMIKQGLRKFSDSSPELTTDELINLADKSFTVNERCNGCGICARVCPVGNIAIQESKPVWLNGCQNCLTCLNWCPNRAIQGRIAQHDYYYRHPEVKLMDMKMQEERTKG